MAEQFCDVGRGIALCYETFGSDRDSPLLLIMGLATQMIGWPDEFCEQLAAQGFYVVRFDNRDCGRSTRVRGRPPTVGQLLRRRIDPVLYTLADMADDAAGLLRELRIGSAHVVGVSMGGMIAQTVAVRRPESVRSLTSIMSTTGNRWKGQPSFAVYRYLVSRAPDDRDGFIDRMLDIFGVIGTQNEAERARTRELAARSFDRGHSAAGAGRQLGAIIASGERTAELRAIRVPTLVIHGTRDRMIGRSGGVATARAIPGARLLLIDGMGHDLPEFAWPRLLGEIAAHARASERAGPRGVAA